MLKKKRLKEKTENRHIDPQIIITITRAINMNVKILFLICTRKYWQYSQFHQIVEVYVLKKTLESIDLIYGIIEIKSIMHEVVHMIKTAWGV